MGPTHLCKSRRTAAVIAAELPRMAHIPFGRLSERNETTQFAHNEPAVVVHSLQHCDAVYGEGLAAVAADVSDRPRLALTSLT